jgi:hypothetical protein
LDEAAVGIIPVENFSCEGGAVSNDTIHTHGLHPLKLIGGIHCPGVNLFSCLMNTGDNLQIDEIGANTEEINICFIIEVTIYGG